VNYTHAIISINTGANETHFAGLAAFRSGERVTISGFEYLVLML
jgi:hypothetical protein